MYSLNYEHCNLCGAYSRWVLRSSYSPGTKPVPQRIIARRLSGLVLPDTLTKIELVHEPRGSGLSIFPITFSNCHAPAHFTLTWPLYAHCFSCHAQTVTYTMIVNVLSMSLCLTTN